MRAVRHRKAARRPKAEQARSLSHVAVVTPYRLGCFGCATGLCFETIATVQEFNAFIWLYTKVIVSTKTPDLLIFALAIYHRPLFL